MLIIKGFIKIAIAVIIIGAVLGVAGLFVGGFSLADIKNGFNSDKDYTLTEKSEALNVQSINLDCVDNIINLKVSADNNFNVSYYTADYYRVVYKTDNNTLSIKAEYTNRLHWFNFRYPSATVRTMTVEIPSTFAGSVTVVNTNGNVNVDKIANVTALNLSTTNGRITATNMTISGNGSFDTTNGKITLSSLNAGGTVDVSTTNGDLDLSTVTCQRLTVDDVNGKINLRKITSDGIDVGNTNGDVTIEVVGSYDDYKIDADTTNGDIEVNGLEITSQIIHADKTKFVKADNTNGDIIITFSA